MTNPTQQNYIQTVTVNLFSNIFSQTINFQPGLNIIAGANGTGKTELLKYINAQRGGANVVFSDNTAPKDIAIFSPKRNAEKKAIEAAHQIVQQDPNVRITTLKAIKNYNMQDAQYQTIKSISEYLASRAEALNRTGTINLVDAYKQIQDENQLIIEKVFNYKLNFIWNTGTKKPSFTIKKMDFELSTAQLSEGENALISLFFAIFDAKEDIQVFLIDEPEVHLNWQLEEKLFQALDWFCTTYGKQVIAVTHSRACFIEPFIQKTQFLAWNDGKIISVQKPDDDIRNLLAGDLVKIIGGVTTESKIVYVEDEAQETVLNEIKSLLGKSLEVTKLNGCSEVKKYSQVFRNLKIDNAYFLIDNDNDAITAIDLSTKYANLIQLKKYCIENYFLNESVLEHIDKRDDKTKPVKDLVKESIKSINKPRFKSFKKLIESGIELEADILDTIDASEFLKILARSLNFADRDAFLKAYLEHLKNTDLLKDTLSEFYELLFK